MITPNIFTQFQPYHPDWETSFIPLSLLTKHSRLIHTSLLGLSHAQVATTSRQLRHLDLWHHNLVLYRPTVSHLILSSFNTAVSLKNSVPQFLHSILSTFHSPRSGNEKCRENTHYFGRKAPLAVHENELKDSVCVADTTLGWILLRIWYVWLQKLKALPYSQRTTISTEGGKKKLRWKVHRISASVRKDLPNQLHYWRSGGCVIFGAL